MLVSLPLKAQETACDGNRYTSRIFTEVDSVMDIQYGQAITLGGKSQKLLMDIYEPHEDAMEKRPLIIMAHGGAFISGDRSQTAEFCREFARRGFVCANIEYRLIDFFVLDSLGLFEAVIMAINDMRAAVRYFREDAASINTYRIASASVFVAGVSAGAIMASHLGFLDPMDEVPDFIQSIIREHGGFEGNSSTNTQFSSEVQGVLNYSGALMRSSWIDGNDVPVYSAHDDQDPTVPCTYNTSNVVPFPVFMYGSCDMKSAADQVKITNALYLVSNSTGHVSYVYNENTRNLVFQESAAFLKAIICGGTSDVSQEFAIKDLGVSVYPNPFLNILNIKTDSEIQSISVNNLTGQCYLEMANFSGDQLDLSNLPGGMYLIRFKTDKGNTVIKAVKQ